MARSALLPIIVILLSPVAFATDDIFQYAVDAPECACDPAIHDPFEKPIRFGYGEYAGLCVNSCHFRAAQLLAQKADGSMRIANLYHDYKYWIANIDPSKVEYANILFERFTFGVDHVVLRLHLANDRPALLNAQIEKVADTFTNDIIISIEGVPPKNVHGHLWQGMKGSYLLVYRILSLQQMADWGIKKHHHPIRQYRLALTKKSLYSILEKAMRESEQKSFQQAYLLFSENCATNAIELTNENHTLSFEEGFSASTPLFNTTHALIAKAKIDTSIPLENLEEELGLPL